VDRRGRPVRIVSEDDLAATREMSLVTLTRTPESELPHEIALSYADSQNEFQMARVMSRRLEGRSARVSETQAAVMTHRAEAQRLADLWLQDLWIGRETARFTARPGLIAIQPGDIVRLGEAGGNRLFQVLQIDDGAARQISARAVDPNVYDAPAPRIASSSTASPKFPGPPHVIALDLAVTRDRPALSWVAAFAEPWPGPLAIVKIANSGASEILGEIEKRATVGETLDELSPGPVGRFDNGSRVTVRLTAGALASVSDYVALGGRTAMAIRGEDGAWEIFSFARAELVGDKTYRLSRLIRGLGGEEHLARRAAPAGSPVVLLDDALVPLARGSSDLGATTTYAIGPANRDIGDPLYVRPVVAATSKALRPYAPAHVRATRTSAGVVVTFLRRSRVDSDAWEPLDIPLGEASEAYEAEIALPTGTRTLSASTASILYPAAQELADFGQPQTALTLSLYQMSASVGRGFPFVGALPVQ
jgi:hypothetical protein